jgi:hypothetical protein
MPTVKPNRLTRSYHGLPPWAVPAVVDRDNNDGGDEHGHAQVLADGAEFTEQEQRGPGLCDTRAHGEDAEQYRFTVAIDSPKWLAVWEMLAMFAERHDTTTPAS